MFEDDLRESHAGQEVEQALTPEANTTTECMDRPDSGNQILALCECRCCRQQKMFDDHEEDWGSRVCADCLVVEDCRDAIMRGQEEHWIDKRCGRWFLWYCHRGVGCDRFWCRIEPPAEDENVYCADDGTLKGPDPWHGYDANGGVKDGWAW